MFININKNKNKNKKSFIKYKCIILFFNIFILLLFELKKNNNKLNQIKICICTIGKNENKYIKEYVEYYKKLGINKIYLYDNNEDINEHFENVIYEYIKNGYVKIENWRGIKSPQMKMYRDCYEKYYDKYEWIIFNDIDEFLYLKNYNNIKAFLNQSKFKKCQSIHLNWLLYTDNNLLYFQNKSIIERFTEKDPIRKQRNIYFYSNGKSILRGHIPNITIINFHFISYSINNCNGFGKEINNKPDYKYYYFKHYYCKSTEEFIEKLKKGDVYNTTNDIKIDSYFSYNKITFEKLNYIEKELGVNLSHYKSQIKKN